ncbi:MAG: hypothetical protein JSV08_10155 [Acidobacteriota bacterium]|nr:MAG: hypothetical protein JSV08_10155 [Acidobacteriota bacterium]
MSLDCRRLKWMLRSREREDLTAAQRERLEAHLASCKACADAFTPLEAPLAEILRDEAKEAARRGEEGTPGETFRLRLEKRLGRAGSDRWGWHLMRSPTPLGLRMPQALAGTLVLVLVLAVAFWVLRPSLEHEEDVRVAEIPMPVKKEAGEKPREPETKPEARVAVPRELESVSRERVASLGYLSGGEEQTERPAAMEPTAVVARKKRVLVADSTPGVAGTDEGETADRVARYTGGYEASRIGPQPASPRATAMAAAAPSAQAELTSPGSPPGTYFGWSKVEGQVGVWRKALTEREIDSALANREGEEKVDQIVRANPQKYYQDYLLGPVADISQPSERAAISLARADHPIAIKAFVDRGDEGSITSLYEFITGSRFGPFGSPSDELQQAAEELAVPAFRERLTGPRKMRAAEALYFLGHVEEALPVLIEAVENGEGRPGAFSRVGKKYDENCGCELWFWDPNLKPVYEAGLKSPVLGVQEKAAHALIRIGENELAFAALQELLKQDIERSLVVDFIGRGILFDLGLIGTPEAMRVVAKFLKHEDAGVRSRAREICTERKFLVDSTPAP